MINRSLSCLGILLLGYALSFATINSNGENGVIRTLSAKTSGKAKLNFGLGLSYGQSQSFVQAPTDTLDAATASNNVFYQENGTWQQKIIKDPAILISSNAFLAIGLLSNWDIAIALPFYYDWSGFGPTDWGLGDLEISTKVAPPPYEKFYNQAYFLGISVPTGMKNAGLFPRHPFYLEDGVVNPAKNFYSSDYVTIKPMMLWTFDIAKAAPKVPLQVHLNIGGVFTNSDRSNVMIGNFALEYTPVEFIDIFTELTGESRWENLAHGYNLRNDPLYLTPGLRINTPAGIFLTLAVDISLSSRNDAERRNWKNPAGNSSGYWYSTGVIPDYGIQFSLGWTGFITPQDDDRDGIKNNDDRCPKDAEDIDGFNDADGCSDPDNDNDGILDIKDKCPNDPEDKDGFMDEDGCPDLDNDKDGIVDTKDQCPLLAEDFDGVEDKDGCPDYDNDKDGVPDSTDRCPNDPEDFDKYKDDDGCPDIDNDGDGVPDLKDRCPDVPETFNGLNDDDGCPDTIVVAPPKRVSNFPKQQTLRGVGFVGTTAELSGDSKVFLDVIVQALKDNPEVEVEIRGHTDKTTGKYTANMVLSQARAESVRNYLIAKGIESARMRAIGFGSTMPIGDDRTAAGRATNRRIELWRMK